MNIVHLSKGLTELYRMVRLDLHGKVEEILIDPIIRPDELCTFD